MRLRRGRENTRAWKRVKDTRQCRRPPSQEETALRRRQGAARVPFATCKLRYRRGISLVRPIPAFASAPAVKFGAFLYMLLKRLRRQNTTWFSLKEIVFGNSLNSPPTRKEVSLSVAKRKTFKFHAQIKSQREGGCSSLVSLNRAQLI